MSAPWYEAFAGWPAEKIAREILPENRHVALAWLSDLRHREQTHALGELQRTINELRQELRIMSTAAVTRDQFDAALQQLLAAEAARDAAVIQAFTDLEAKVAAGGVTTQEDFTAELASVKTPLTTPARPPCRRRRSPRLRLPLRRLPPPPPPPNPPLQPINLPLLAPWQPARGDRESFVSDTNSLRKSLP